MASDSDLAASIVIALVLIAIALCAWPGFARARARDLAGYWADAGGALYEIRTGPGDRELVAHGGATPTRAGRPGLSVWPGRITGVRGVALGPKKGQLDLGGRRISWGGGGVWTRQGIR